MIWGGLAKNNFNTTDSRKKSINLSANLCESKKTKGNFMNDNLSDTSTFDTILDKLNTLNLATRKKGTMFEKLCTHLLREKDTANVYKEICLWSEWERNDGNDKGIDIIIQTKNDEFIAVQCKFFTSKKVDLSDLSTYFTQLQSGVGNVKFSKGIIITTNDLGKNVLDTIKQIQLTMPIDIITLEDFKNSAINWEVLSPKSLELPLYAKKQPLPHQKDALQSTKEYFANPANTRGKLIMACGTGKTYTSLKILEMLTPKDSIVVFLAPSIALVGQTFREYCQQKSDDFVACIVCSDEKSGKTQDDDIDLLELPLTPSTRPSDIQKAYHLAKKDSKRFIIFSTYQSSIRLKETQNLGFLDEIDLLICDEAHRSVGAMYSGAQKDTLNAFTLCHSDENIKAKKRVYMTATPKVYSTASKSKGIESGNEVFSMDDESIFGDEIFVLNFSNAIEKKLLTDYKVIILAIKQEGMAKVANNAIAKLKSQNSNIDEKLIDLDFVCKIIGTHKGLAKNDLVTLNENGEIDNDFLEEMDKQVSTRAINFCRNIKASKNITHSFKTIIESYDEELKKDSFKNLDISIDHIDGTMNAKMRLEKLSELNQPKAHTCNILSNARCLSEGIDVPALDSVVFFDGRSAQVDIIQSVGRVMRKSAQKEIGYIILPLALSENELKNLDEAVSNTNFQNIWNVLKALRSHDETLVDEAVFREKIKIAVSDYIGGESSEKPNDEKPYEPRLFDSFTLSELANTIYNAMPTKLGDKGYWQSFSAKTAKIVEKLNTRLSDIFAHCPEILSDFLASLKENIHPNIKQSEAMDMICSHIITKPIFDALFGENINDNPIGKALDEVSDKLHQLGLDDEETRSLNALYKSVGESARLAKSDKSKQELIKNLYDTFFRSAFKKQAERLGIVYTPLEVVDFILHSTNALLKKHFGLDFNDSSVKVFDPFTGTGSFITRLLSKENALIADENIKSKFTQGIFAQDIVLLAYYIALINITQMGQSRESTLAKFSNIALCDSLDYLDNVPQDSGLFAKEFRDLEANKHIKDIIANENIKVILGNPPYSGGAGNENDNNANISHPILEQRVRETYGKDTRAQNANNTRDTLIQAIRMATDKLDKQGIIGFVVNGGFIDSSSADGFRKCVVKEFKEIYVLNLRGNQRTQGEMSKKEGGKIFGGGSRAGVAIVFFVKDVNAQKECQIHYYDIGDYLIREAKLEKLEIFKSLESVPFSKITPNDKGDWITQRGSDFDNLLPLKSDKNTQGIFMITATGIQSSGDAWAYNFSKNTLRDSMQRCIDTYNDDLAKFDREEFVKKHKDSKKVDLYKQLNDTDISTDKTRIAWTANLKNSFIGDKKFENFDENKVRIAFYRPFTKSYLYFDEEWNERQSQFPQIFPNKESENVAILTSLMATKDFSSFIVNGIADYQTLSNTSAFPLYYYLANGERECAISDFAKSAFEKHLGFGVEKEDIFYYIYALFSHKGFCEKYKFELCKEAPRISISKDFMTLANLGRKLAQLHLDYENGECYKEVEFREGLLTDKDNDELYKVAKIIKDKEGATLHYNANIMLKNIPPKAYAYKINGRSVVDIFIDRYQVKTDKASLIKNNPNDFRGGKYIFELLCRIIVLCEKSVDIIESISKMKCE